MQKYIAMRFLSATGRIRTSGLPGRRTTTGWYRLTMKREFCWFCTAAPKTGKSPLLVVTTGFSDILWCYLHSSGQMVVKMQINSVRTYGKNTFNKFQKGSFNSILNILHRRQLLFQFPGISWPICAKRLSEIFTRKCGTRRVWTAEEIYPRSRSKGYTTRCAASCRRPWTRDTWHIIPRGGATSRKGRKKNIPWLMRKLSRSWLQRLKVRVWNTKPISSW